MDDILYIIRKLDEHAEYIIEMDETYETPDITNKQMKMRRASTEMDYRGEIPTEIVEDFRVQAFDASKICQECGVKHQEFSKILTVIG